MQRAFWQVLLGLAMAVVFVGSVFAAETQAEGREGSVMQTLKAGDVAPDFTLPDATGNSVSLSALKGKYVVLYFYPKDNTPGCTREACDFRDFQKQFQDLNAVILGVSKDSSQSHTEFATRYGLPFHLLADTGGEVVKAYGAWKPNWLTGVVGLGIERTTFVIDPDGRIQRIYPKVSVGGHVAQVLEDLRKEKPSASSGQPGNP